MAGQVGEARSEHGREQEMREGRRWVGGGGGLPGKKEGPKELLKETD